MNFHPDFDSVRAPLDRLNLLEAAAGTGKTHNIQNIAARLIVENNLPIESILVTTFTKAAAAELKSRIRGNLLAMRNVLDQLSADVNACDLIGHAVEIGVSRAECRRRISRALADFDLCAIGTIHGFCFRVLCDYSFESGGRFAPELVESDEDEVERLLLDFYRAFLYGEAEGGLRAALCAGKLPWLRGQLSLRLRHPEMRRIAPRIPAGISSPEEAAGVLRQWLFEVAEAGISELYDQFNYACSTANLERKSALLREFHAHPERVPDELPGELAVLAPEELRSKAKVALKRDPEALERLLTLPQVRRCGEIAQLLAAFDTLLLDHVERRLLPRRAEFHERENTATFDAVVTRLREALETPDSPLPGILRSRFPAGIVDEFQDTDVDQYRIFRKLFVEEPGSTLFLVGDPRQAIYAFRGGDLATYFLARRELETRGGRVYTLRKNYRSAARIVGAVNQLYAAHAAPFGIPGLALPEQLSRPPEEAKALLENGVELAHPLEIVPLTDKTPEECCALCADAISRMLSSGCFQVPAPDLPAGRTLSPADIAVLLNSWREAEQLHAMLAKRNIPAVILDGRNVFLSDDATELAVAMAAAADPAGDEKVVRAAATPLAGVPLARLAAFADGKDEEGLEELRGKFIALSAEWKERSFIAMFNRLLEFFELPVRYAALRSGERKLTNLFQLADLLHETDAGSFHSPESLLLFLRRSIAEASSDRSERFKQQRETDRPAVILNTIHGSKGLEYPVVFLPTLFSGCSAPKGEKPFHDADGVLTVDYTGQGGERAFDEEFQERLRLAYVALTRARCRCVVFRGKTGKRMSPLEWLLRMGKHPLEPGESPTKLLKEAPEAPIPAALCGDVPEEEAEIYHPEPEKLPALSRREFDAGALPADWRFLSFSGLAGDHSPLPGRDLFAPENADENESAAEDETVPPEAGSIFSLRGSAEFGSAVHRIFELADFASSRSELEKLSSRILKIHGFSDEPTRRAVSAMVDDVRNAPLGSFSLSLLDRKKRFAETEFLYEFRNGFDCGRLMRTVNDSCVRKFSVPPMTDGEFRSFSGGFMNGYIDLLFEHDGRCYILDWKTNRLGGRPEDFAPSRLPGAMRDGGYFLQYLIYTVALCRLLRSRLPEFGKEHYERLFGGVFYLFVRGVSPLHPGRGVFFDRPDYDLILKLEEMIG